MRFRRLGKKALPESRQQQSGKRLPILSIAVPLNGLHALLEIDFERDFARETFWLVFGGCGSAVLAPASGDWVLWSGLAFGLIRY